MQNENDFGIDLGDLDLDFDFGFTAVSHETVTQSKEQIEKVEAKITESSGVVTAELTPQLNALEAKLQQLITLQTEKNEDELENKKVQLESEYSGKMKGLEKLTLPLLYNLLKTSDEPYIHWPDRKQIIETQIRKILGITRNS
jgi:hypothetical protein|tara:strand:- start:958 stop:1386 length:429 start_codon:yes stop_codon:yes gene_type:complete